MNNVDDMHDMQRSGDEQRSSKAVRGHNMHDMQRSTKERAEISGGLSPWFELCVGVERFVREICGPESAKVHTRID